MRNATSGRARAAGREPREASAVAPRGRRRRRIAWWLLAVLATAALGFVWYQFGSFNPSAGRLSPQVHPLFFPVLMVHITGASIALATGIPQVWPGLRERHPRIHRYLGRAYVLAGVYPAGIASLVLLTCWPEHPVNEFSDLLTTPLWLAATTVGFIFTRRHRYADHRRWMLRSFALTYSFIVSVILTFPVLFLFRVEYHAQFAGNTTELNQLSSGVSVWIAWIVSLIAIEWWLDRELIQRPRRAGPERPQSPTESPFAGQPPQAARS